MGVIKGPRFGAVNLFANVNTSLYVCRSCRKTIVNSSIYPRQTRYASNKNLPFTERLRRKIWGTDNPPGLKDPYGGPGFFERRAQRRKTSEEVEQDTAARQATEESEAVQELSTGESVPSETGRVPRPGLKPTPRDLPAQKLEKYVPAETWEGLEHIGSSGGWRTLPVSEEELTSSWKEQFHSSKAAASSLDFTTLTSIMHQAIVESLVSREAGQKEPNFRYLQDEIVTVTGARIVLSTDNSISHLDYASKDDQEIFIDIISAATESDRSGPKTVEDNSNAIENIPESDAWREDVISGYIPEDQSFLNARFNFSDPLTFTILKRFSGLSGMTIPDPFLNSLRSEAKPLSHLIQLLAESTKPKPKNLAETLANSTTLNSQGNIMVLPRRETPVDKEKEIGRWKVIEKELTLRGLPVLGRAHIS